MNADIEEAKDATKSGELFAEYVATNRLIRLLYLCINLVFLAIIFTTLILHLIDDDYDSATDSSSSSPSSSSSSAASSSTSTSTKASVATQNIAFSVGISISVALCLVDIWMIFYRKSSVSPILESLVIFLKESVVLASILLRYSVSEAKTHNQYQELVFALLCISIELKRRVMLFPIPATLFQILIFFFVQDFSKSAIVFFSISLVAILLLTRLDQVLNRKVDATMFASKSFQPSQSLTVQEQQTRAKGSLTYSMQLKYACMTGSSSIKKIAKQQRPQSGIESFNAQTKLNHIPSTSPILLSGIPLEKMRSEIMQNSQMKSDMCSACLNGNATTMINSLAGGPNKQVMQIGGGSFLHGLNSTKGIGSKMRQSSNAMITSNALPFSKKSPSHLLKNSSLPRMRNQEGLNLLPNAVPFQYLIAKPSQTHAKNIEILEIKNEFDIINELYVDDLFMNIGTFIKQAFNKKYEKNFKSRRQARLCSNSDRSAQFQMIVQYIQFTAPAPQTFEDFSPTQSQQVNIVNVPPQSAGFPGSAALGGTPAATTTMASAAQTNTGFGVFSNANSNLNSAHANVNPSSEPLLVLYFIDVTDLCKEVNQNATQRAGGESKSYEEDLLATVSHDIKNLMNGMIQMLDLCEKNIGQLRENPNQIDLIPPTQSVLNHVVKSSKLLLFLVYDIQDFSQNAKKKLRLVAEKLNLDEVGEEIRGIFEEKLLLKKITFKFVSRLNSPMISTDGLRLKQVLINLVSNAVKYTKSGHIEVLIEHKQKSELIRITVSDTGKGIPEAIRNQLFQYYSTFDSKQGDNPRGVGLGLAITLKIVQLMGPENQQIEIKSEPNVGTTISFDIFEKLQDRHFFEGGVVASSVSLLNRSQNRLMSDELPGTMTTTTYEAKRKKKAETPDTDTVTEVKLMNRVLDARLESDPCQEAVMNRISQGGSGGANRFAYKHQPMQQQSSQLFLQQSDQPTTSGVFANNTNNNESSALNTLSSRFFEGEPAEFDEHTLEGNLHSYQRLYSQGIPQPSSRVQRVTSDFTRKFDKGDSKVAQQQTQQCSSNQKSDESLNLSSQRISSVSMRHIEKDNETARHPVSRNQYSERPTSCNNYNTNTNMNANVNLGKNICGSIIISPVLSRSESKRCIRKMSSSFFLNNNQNLQGSNQNLSNNNLENVDVSNAEFEAILIANGIKHIMIIDDQVINTFALNTTLGFLVDVKVSVGHSGQEVLNVLHNDPNAVQLVFIDQSMPELTGAETIDFIKEINYSIITILVSGFARIQDISHHRLIQADLFLVKPTRIVDIKRKIVSLFLTRQADIFDRMEEQEIEDDDNEIHDSFDH